MSPAILAEVAPTASEANRKHTSKKLKASLDSLLLGRDYWKHRKIIKVNILYVPRNKSLNEKMSQNYSTEYKKRQEAKGLTYLIFPAWKRRRSVTLEERKIKIKVREAAAKNEGENGGKKRHQKSFENGDKKWRSRRRRHIVNIPGVLNTFCCPISNYAIHQQLIEKRG